MLTPRDCAPYDEQGRDNPEAVATVGNPRVEGRTATVSQKERAVACARCTVRGPRACTSKGGAGPAFCPTLHLTEAVQRGRNEYQDGWVREFARQASIQEAECYASRDAEPYVRRPTKPRLQEICEFARRMGYHRLGLAFCSGLAAEARALVEVLEGAGFEVVSVACKVGCVPKEELGLGENEKVRPGRFEAMCNPITQAEILNRAGTDLNVMLGLCVGHDALFLKYAQAPTTVFAVKDRVLAHNPLGALYTLRSYYSRFLPPTGERGGGQRRE